MLKRIDARIPEELLIAIKEAAKDEGVTVTDIMIECFNLYLTAKKEEEEIKGRKQPCQSMPDVKIVDSGASGEAEKPASKPIIAKVEPGARKPLPNGYIPKSAVELRAAYLSNNPLSICHGCHNFNRDCVCGKTI